MAGIVGVTERISPSEGANEAAIYYSPPSRQLLYCRPRHLFCQDLFGDIQIGLHPVALEVIALIVDVEVGFGFDGSHVIKRYLEVDQPVTDGLSLLG